MHKLQKGFGTVKIGNCIPSFVVENINKAESYGTRHFYNDPPFKVAVNGLVFITDRLKDISYKVYDDNENKNIEYINETQIIFQIFHIIVLQY